MATESLIVELDARTKKLEDKLSRTEKKLNSTGKSAKKTGGSFADLTKKSEELASKGILAVGAAATATVVSITALVDVVSSYAREVKIASQLSGDAVEKLQLMAHATATVGIGVEDLGDKFKDTREKIGDFLNTGGGGFMDFVDAMKLTKTEAAAVANEFKHMSGSEILQEMVTRMQGAKVSAVQMSHALEGMASDTTKLIPLLIDGGREMQNLMDSARSVSIPLTNEDINKFIKMGDSAKLAGASLKSLGEQILLDLGDAFVEAAGKAAHFYASLNKGTIAQITVRLAKIKEEKDEILKVQKAQQRGIGRTGKILKDNATLREGHEVKLNALLEERIKLQKDLAELSFGIDAETGVGKIDSKNKNPNGGGTGATGTGDEIQAIADRFKSEEKLLTAKLEKDLEIIGENDELKELLHQEYLDNIFNMEEDAASRQKDLDEKINEDKLKREEKAAASKRKLALSNATALISIASSLFGENEKIAKAMFIADKAVAVSNIFINTQAAAVKSLTIDPTGAMAAGIETNGYIRMAAVAASVLGGISSGGGGASSSGNIPTQTQQDQAQSFQPETSNLELSESSASGSQVLNITVPDGDEIGEAIANWLSKAQTEGRA